MRWISSMNRIEPSSRLVRNGSRSAGLDERRAAGHLDRRAEFVGQHGGERGLAEAGRAVEEDVPERLLELLASRATAISSRSATFRWPMTSLSSFGRRAASLLLDRRRAGAVVMTFSRAMLTSSRVDVVGEQELRSPVSSRISWAVTAVASARRADRELVARRACRSSWIVLPLFGPVGAP